MTADGGAARLVRVYGLWILLVTAVVMVAGYEVSMLSPTVYRSAAIVVIEARVRANTTPVQPEMGTEKELARSGLVVRPAARELGVDAATLADGVCAVVRALRTEPLFARIVDVDPELLLPYLLDHRGRNQDHLLALLAAGIRRGQEAGTVRAGDPTVMARALQLAAQGFLFSAGTMTDEQVSLETLDAELRKLAKRHLAP